MVHGGSLSSDHFVVLGELALLDLLQCLGLGVLCDDLPEGGASLSVSSSRLLGGQKLTAHGGGEGVELGQSPGVLEVVGLPEADETLGLDVDESLDAVGLDHAANIGVGEDGTGEEVSILHGGRLVGSSEDGVQLLESGLSPDDKAAEVTSRGEEQQVQGRHTSHLNTSQISARVLNTLHIKYT